MQIQKIFSDINGDEKLYSVLMTEEELAMFSEEVEEEKKSSKGKKAAAVAAGTTVATAGTIVGAKKAGEKMVKDHLNNVGKMKELVKKEMKSGKTLNEADKAARKAVMENSLGAKLQKPAAAVTKAGKAIAQHVGRNGKAYGIGAGVAATAAAGTVIAKKRNKKN